MSNIDTEGTLRYRLRHLHQDGGQAMSAVAAPTCGCMTEDLRDGLGERVVEHSLRCELHPLHDPDVCPGCGRAFAGPRGVTAHRTARLVAMGCKL